MLASSACRRPQLAALDYELNKIATLFHAKTFQSLRICYEPTPIPTMVVPGRDPSEISSGGALQFHCRLISSPATNVLFDCATDENMPVSKR